MPRTVGAKHKLGNKAHCVLKDFFLLVKFDTNYNWLL